jgi:error-prone DNA polymerase
VAGLVLVRQKPGSAKGVLFITLEDETEVANLIVWPARGRVQRVGEVVHLIAEHLIDLSDLLGRVGERNEPFPVPHG